MEKSIRPQQVIDFVRISPLRILTITSRYPPYHFGGYELRCKNIMDALAGRGHVILILTSQKETRASLFHGGPEYSIHRKLHLRLNVGGLLARMTMNRFSYPLAILLIFVRELLFDYQDIKFVDEQIEQFQPNVIYLGHITNLSRAIMPYLADRNIPLVYDEGGSGLIDSWTEKGIWYKLIEKFPNTALIANGVKSLVVKTICRLTGNRLKPQWSWPKGMKIIFNSELNHTNAFSMGVPTDGSKVIHSGIDTELFSFHRREEFHCPLVLIVPGRIEPRKGQIDAVRLLKRLNDCGIDTQMILAGEKWVDSYYREVLGEIKALHLEAKVEIHPMVTQEQLARMYQGSDMCFFPSYFRTGFSRVPLEAMSCGCVMISYGNEGSDEVIRDGQTGFLVSAEDYIGIITKIKELGNSPQTIYTILHAARKDVEESFSMQKYIDQIEEIITGAQQ